MLLKKTDLLMCLYAREHADHMGLADVRPNTDEDEKHAIKARLTEAGLLEHDLQTTQKYHFSAYAQVILDTIGTPDAWVDVENLKQGIRRWLFMKEAFYICVEEKEENVQVDMLPLLPLLIGGYASLLKDLRDNTYGQVEADQWNEDARLVNVQICSLHDKLVLEIDQQGVARQSDGGNISFWQHSQESCTNAITMRMLHALQKEAEK